MVQLRQVVLGVPVQLGEARRLLELEARVEALVDNGSSPPLLEQRLTLVPFVASLNERGPTYVWPNSIELTV